MNDGEAKVMFDRFWAAFIAKDVEELAGHFGDSGSFEDVALKFVGHGAGAVRRYWDAFNGALPDWACDRHELVVARSGFAVRYTVHAHLHGALGPLVGHGEQLEIVVSAMVELGDGAIRSHRQYWNLTGALAQLGVTQVPRVVPGAPVSSGVA
jgi:SnoaL-like polyketide cyclase